MSQTDSASQHDPIDKVEKHTGIEHHESLSNETAVGHLAHQLDHEETPLGALRSHPIPCLWILYAIWILMATSFDNNASSSILGIPQFRKDFGHKFGEEYVLPAQWQSAYSGGPAAATIIGAFASGCKLSRVNNLEIILTGI